MDGSAGQTTKLSGGRDNPGSREPRPLSQLSLSAFGSISDVDLIGKTSSELESLKKPVDNELKNLQSPGIRNALLPQLGAGYGPATLLSQTRIVPKHKVAASIKGERPLS